MAQSYGDYKTPINVNELTEIVRHTPQEMQGCAQVANPPTGKALGLKHGDTLQYTFFANMSTTGGALTETEPVPTGSLTPIKATMTVLEYGNGIDWTGLLEDLARIEVLDSFMQALMDDQRKLENTQTYNQLILTDYNAVFESTGDEFVTNGTPTGTMDENVSLANLWFLYEKATDNLIPPFDGESFVFITGVQNTVALRQDSSLTTMLQEDSGRASLNGEIGRVASCRVVEDNHAIDKTAGATPVNFNEGLYVGADAVQHEVAKAWEIRHEDSDFGRDNKFAYLGIMGWNKTLDQTTHSREHIIQVTSV